MSLPMRNKKKGSYNGSCRQILLDYMPDFCWQTAYEILCMVEFMDDRIEDKNVAVSLNKMIGNGEVEYRVIKQDRVKRGKHWGHIFEYRRVR